MAIKQILMNTEMVRAILDGRKTCTRRVVKPQPTNSREYGLQWKGIYGELELPLSIESYAYSFGSYAPYQPGDILYVREAWGISNMDDESKMAYIVYRASEEQENEGCREVHLPDEKFEKMYESMAESEPEWHPSIHMPKEAARIWLKVTDVRVEQLQDITPKDAENEGVGNLFYEDIGYSKKDYGTEVDPEYGIVKEQFAWLWESTIKKSELDCYGWKANPWVWVIEFERCEKPKEASDDN